MKSVLVDQMDGQTGIFMSYSQGYCLNLKKNDKDIIVQWPNLKNLSGGLNLSCGLNMVVST